MKREENIIIAEKLHQEERSEMRSFRNNILLNVLEYNNINKFKYNLFTKANGLTIINVNNLKHLP